MSLSATLEAEIAAAPASHLTEAFQAFERASATMTRHYEALQRRVEDLNLELEEKNEELRRTLAEREAFSRYLESLLESLTNGVVAITADGRIATVNRAAEEMLGDRRERLIGARFADVLPALAGEAAMNENGGESGDAAMEVIVEPRGGAGEAKTLEAQIRPTTDLPGRKGGRLLIMRDATELRRLERAANLRNRLTAMGEMAMNVAHEVRNPLGSIELFASALRQELAEDSETQRLVDFISQGVRSIDNIVGNILMFARQMAPSLESVEPAALLDDVLVYARFHMEQKEITLERRDRVNGARCLGDVELLKQVFLNLFLNATQAMDTGGRLRLETVAEARHVAFVVEDNGRGIPPEALPKIFDPFYTTKRRGTGLGLTICHNIIQAHEGSIEVESEAGVGTCFIIRIPRA